MKRTYFRELNLRYETVKSRLGKNIEMNKQNSLSNLEFSSCASFWSINIFVRIFKHIHLLLFLFHKWSHTEWRKVKDERQDRTCRRFTKELRLTLIFSLIKTCWANDGYFTRYFLDIYPNERRGVHKLILNIISTYYLIKIYRHWNLYNLYKLGSSLRLR